MIHHKQTINSLKVQRDILLLVLGIFVICLVGSYVARRRIISPIADDPIIKVVYASEEAPELEQIVSYITKVFAPEGKQVVVKAIQCFYGESGLRNNAVGVNKNGTNDVGVAQINSIHGMSTEDRMNYKKNIDKAYKIYKSRGNFSAWYAPACR